MSFSYGVAVVLATAAFAGCTRAQSPASDPPALPPTTVVVVEAQPRPIEDATEYVGSLRSLISTAIQPQVEGQITNIFVTSGEFVRRGAPLLQIDPRRQQAAVSSQEADRASKEANVAFARQQASRAAQLLGAGAISRQEMEQAETNLRTAEADLASLQAQVQQQQVQLRYFTVTAPTDGFVGDVPVRVGNQVTPQTVLTTLDQNRALEVHVSVPVDRAPDLKNGLPLHVLGSNSDTLAESSVSFISNHVDDGTQTLLVKGQVRNPDGALRGAQFVRARIVWRTTEGLLIPVTAVSRINGAHFGFVAEAVDGGMVARQRSLRLGSIVGDSYPVLSGIEVGERIVVSGVQKLIDGAPIVPSPAGATTN
jgi:RND family efflux transporter MFP subunit